MGATNRSKSTMTSEQNNFAMRGTLEGHSNWVTAIATTNENPDMILSASRDKTVMVWQLTREDGNYEVARSENHRFFISTTDGFFVILYISATVLQNRTPKRRQKADVVPFKRGCCG